MIASPFFAVWLVFSGTPAIIDGDTLRLEGERLRLIGIDAPERGWPGGAEATAALRRLLGTGTIECGWGGRRDRYRRPLVVCLTPDGRDAGEEMVKLGWARARYGRYYIRAEYAARRSRKGMWRRDTAEGRTTWTDGR